MSETGGGPARTAELYAAAAVAAGQLPVVWLLWWLGELSGDSYGQGINSLGLVCVAVFVPLVLPVVGLLQALAQPLPAALLASRVPGPRRAWHAALSALTGVAWAGLATALWGWSFPHTAALFAALGVLPALAMGRPRRGFRGVWFRAGTVSLALFLLVGAGGALATAVGLIKEYEPPVLSAAQVAGVWRGADGALLRLDPDGTAELERTPTESGAGLRKPWVRCDGGGTWTLERANRDPDQTRDGVALHPSGDCGRDTYWVIGGTESDPELFVLFGDPDAGELWILER
ncbi:hypothetical protein [Streptomyces sp. NPDC000983]|uniref:hypothetical protein n=1 Tax=Streptomyces sp. NPDC000983 TaxID=3154373 RepID=UPI00332071D2